MTVKGPSGRRDDAGGCRDGLAARILESVMPAADRTRAFHLLHQSGCFVIPNPWDRGSARLLAQLGFRALATTSSGFAWSMGRPDNGVMLNQALAHFRGLAATVHIPAPPGFFHRQARPPAQAPHNVL